MHKVNVGVLWILFLLTMTSLSACGDNGESAHTLQFEVAAVTADELDCLATIRVTRKGSNEGEVTVHYQTSDGTGMAGQNYRATEGILTWANGDSEVKTFEVPLLFDIATDDKTVNLELTSPTGGAQLGKPATAVLNIANRVCEEITQDFSSDVTLPKACYLASRGISVSGHLNIQPGAVLVFAEEKSLSVLSNGILTAKGTEACPILFTAEERSPGHWHGLNISTDPVNLNEIEHAIVEYAGREDYQEGNIIVKNLSRVSVSNTTMRHSRSYGFFISDESTVDDFSNNTITQNARAGHTYARTARFLDGSSQYSGNTEDVVLVTNYGDHADVIEDGTWDALDADYLFDKSFGVHAHLTIEPGARLMFMEDTRMTIVDGGQLTAVGTTEDPILFSASDQIPGHWYGLHFSSAPADVSRIEHAIVEYAGREDYQEGNIIVKNLSRVSVSNTTMRHSRSYGFFISDESTVDDFSNNTITQNARAGHTYARTARFLDGSSQYSGNTEDVVLVTNYGDHADVIEDGTWDALDADYLFDKSFGVHAHLTIEPGARLMFMEDTRMTIVDGGQLTAVGTTEDPILFSASDQIPGHWYGLHFSSAPADVSRIEHAIVEYAGREDYQEGNIIVKNLSRVSVSNTTMRHSRSYGFFISDESTVDDFSNNTITQNARAGHTYARTARFLDGSSQYSGNTEDVVLVTNYGDHADVIEDGTWDALDADYLFDESFGVHAHLTIEPGARLVFMGGKGLSVSGNGRLTAAGTAADPIVFTSDQQVAGNWVGIRLTGAPGVENTLDHVVIQYGGLDTYQPANLAVLGETSASLTNSTIENSSGYGIWIAAEASLSQSDNTITNCTMGEVFEEPP